MKNDNILVQLLGQVTKIQTMADNSIRVIFDTNELSESESNAITELYKLKVNIENRPQYMTLTNFNPNENDPEINDVFDV